MLFFHFSQSTTVIEEETLKRAQWDSKLEFLMSCVAFSVGLGNIWRFPYTAYENGGGAFLVPYIIVLFIIGKPIYYMEMILGQFSSRSCIQVWSISPAFRGISIITILSIIHIQGGLNKITISTYNNTFF